MDIKVFDSELEVMKLLWDYGELLAKEIAAKLSKKNGWTTNTTYTIIDRLEKKGALSKSGPSARKTICTALISREQVQNTELNELVNKVFMGSTKSVFSALVDSRPLPDELIEKLRGVIEEME